MQLNFTKFFLPNVNNKARFFSLKMLILFFIADILITISIFSPALCSAEMYENQIHRHESSSQRTSSSAMKKQLSNSTMHGSAGTEIIAKESSHQTYTRYVSKVNMLNA